MGSSPRLGPSGADHFVPADGIGGKPWGILAAVTPPAKVAINVDVVGIDHFGNIRMDETETLPSLTLPSTAMWRNGNR